MPTTAMLIEDLVRTRQEAGGAADDKFWMLMERFRADLLNQAFGILGNQQDAEDIAQESLCQAFLKLHQLRDPSKIGSWMRGINRNLANNFLRNRGRQREERLATAQADALEAPSVRDAILQKVEREQKVAQAVDALPEQFREVMVHRYWENLGTEEIASRLGLPSGTVRSRLSRGFRQLALRLDSQQQNQESA